MTDTLTTLLEQYDLGGFIAAYRQFHFEWAGGDTDPDASLYAMHGFGGTPMPFPPGRPPAEELLAGSLLFFPMHEPLVADSALCCDGLRRDVEDFDIGDSDAYGLLVEVHDDKLSLHPTLLDGSSGRVPTLDLQGHCSVLDEPLRRFATQFVSKD
jgi:hypothetical protein